MTASTLARRPAPGSARPSSSGRAAVGGRALLGYLHKQRDALSTAEAGARSGDPDAVHDMRVATRRLRSALRTFRPVLRPWQPLRDELKWLADALGAVRDGDVMAARLGAELDAQPPELVVGPVRNRLRLTGDLARARQALTAALDSPRYRALLGTLDEVTPTGPVRKGRLRKAARRDLRRADKRLTQARSDEQLHAARKAYKRARYAVEVLRPVAGKRAQRLRKRLGDLQDVLGAHQDAVTTQALLRREAMRAYAGGENTFTYGLLTGRQQHAAARSRARVPAVRERAAKAAGWLQ